MITIVAKNFIGGVWHEGELDLTTQNPAKVVEVAGQAHSASPEDVSYAVKVAQKALEKSQDAGPAKRADLIDALVQPMRRYANEIAKYLTHECGFTLKESQDEVLEAIRFCQLMAGRSAELKSRQMSWYPASRETRFVQKPVGVVACMPSWREPFAGALKLALPAVAAGSTVILKAPQDAIAVSQWLARLILESGLGEGYISVIHGPDDACGNLLASDPGVHSVFGDFDLPTLIKYRGIVAQRPEGAVVSASVGLNGLVVFGDANLEQAANMALTGALYKAGQSRNSTKVAWVAEPVMEALVRKIDDSVKLIRVGNGLAEDSTMGPVINSSVLDRYLEHTSSVQGSILSQASRYDDETRSEGLFVRPHIVEGDAKQRSFEGDGPSLLIQPLESLDLYSNGLRLNSLAIATKSTDNVRKVREKAKYNRLFVNCPTTTRLAPNIDRDFDAASRTVCLGIEA